jgi:protein-tyrosine phosphatase
MTMKYPIAFAVALALSAPAWAGEAAPAVTHAQPETQAERFILLEGGRNFRDVGGYRTADGHTVKRGVMYRSGSLGSLSPAGQQTLSGLGIKSIIDLRSTDERSHDNGDWLATSGQGYWTRDYGMSHGDIAKLFSSSGPPTAESTKAMMSQAYRTLPKEQASGYREMFARLVAGKEPLVVNCTAGKDRTGIAAALVLTALGVPYETVREDFLLSNNAPGMDTLTGSLPGPLAKLPPEVLKPLAGVEDEYLDTAFAQLKQDYGSVDNYLEKELGVGPREVTALRHNMLN